MKDDIITIQNEGQIVQLTNYYQTAQAKRGEVYLTWNAGCGRLLLPDSMRHMLTDMRCEKVQVTRKQQGIEILFDDLTDYPFRLLIAHEQNDRPIESGDCVFSVYVRLGEKWQKPCACVVEHGGVGNKNASKDRDSHLNMRCNSRDKAGWVKQAQREGLKTTEWVEKILNTALDKDLTR